MSRSTFAIGFKRLTDLRCVSVCMCARQQRETKKISLLLAYQANDAANKQKKSQRKKERETLVV